MNSVEIEGFTSFSKVHNFQGGAFSHRFSITLQAGKDMTGQYRKEYIDVRLSSECSAQIQYPGDGSRIKVKGRLRCEPWVDRNQQKRKAIYVEGFDAYIVSAPQQQQVPQQQMQGYQQQAPQQAPRQQAPQQHKQPYRPQHNNPNQYKANSSARSEEVEFHRQQQAAYKPAEEYSYNNGAPKAPQAPQMPMQDFDGIPF